MNSKDTGKDRASTDSELFELVEKLTTTGRPKLDEAGMKTLKGICKKSDDNVKQAYYLIWTQLEKDHAEIRLSSVQIINELFLRSHCFREMLLSDFQQFMELSLEINPKLPLPNPIPAAKAMKSQVTIFVNKWHEQFGSCYKKLELGYNFLKNCKKINFANQSSIARNERELSQRNARIELINQNRVKSAIEELDELVSDVQSCITETENCLSLLLPDPGSFEVNEFPSGCRGNFLNSKVPSLHDVPLKHDQIQDCATTSLLESSERSNSIEKQIDTSVSNYEVNDESQNDVSESTSDVESDSEMESHGFSRKHGAVSYNSSVQINLINPDQIVIYKTEDNADILRTLSDEVTLINNKYCLAVKKLLKIFSKSGAHEKHVKAAVDLKTSLEAVLKRVNKLQVKDSVIPFRKVSRDEQDEEESSDDEFVEVPEKDGYEAYPPEFLERRNHKPSSKSQSFSTTSKDWNVDKILTGIDEHDPAHCASTIKKLMENVKNFENVETVENPQPSTSKQGQTTDDSNPLLKHAPIVPFGIDLYHWGDDKVEAPMLVRNDPEMLKWWKSTDQEATVDVQALASMKERVINFVGKFEPVEWKCRAPLPNGKLCWRMDRKKCPFHGKIIARDNQGRPNGPDKDLQNSETQTKKVVNDWEDPELHAEIFAATGVDLSRKSGRKGKAKTSAEPGLTDIKSLNSNTSRKRLETKVLKRSSVKRVAETLNNLDAKRFHDKFGNNFNYTYTH